MIGKPRTEQIGNWSNYTKMAPLPMHTMWGTSPHETVFAIIPIFFYTQITAMLISVLHPRNQEMQFLIEFVTLVIPLVLNLTALSEFTTHILVISFIVYVIGIVFLHKGYQKKTQKFSDITISHSVTHCRAATNIISVLAILAVDFRVFPRRFAKTENFGFSLMDTGVGLYVFVNGIVDTVRRTTFHDSVKGSLPLIVLGLLRYLTTWQIDYNVPVTEYGLHWNFFLTLAVVKILVGFFLQVVHVKFVVINAMLLLVSHEILLQMGMARFVLSSRKRDSFVTANREGLISLVGYASIYLFSVYLSHLLDIKSCKNRGKGPLLKIGAVAGALWFFMLISEKTFGISRKLANSAFCLWVLFIGVLMYGLFYAGVLVQGWVFKNKSCVYSPLILQAINYNGLLFFLTGNLLTGLINIVCTPSNFNGTSGLGVIVGYMFVNCAVVYVLYKKKKKMKL